MSPPLTRVENQQQRQSTVVMEDPPEDEAFIEQSFFDFSQYQAHSNSNDRDTYLPLPEPTLESIPDQAAITSPASSSSFSVQESIYNSPKSSSAATSPESNMLEKQLSRQPCRSPAGMSDSTQQATENSRDCDSVSRNDLFKSLPEVKMEHSTDVKVADYSDLQIRLLGVPETGAKSRVETQIKLCIQLVTRNGVKVTRWPCLRVPESMLAKSKQRKSQQRRLAKYATMYDEPQMLDMDATVFCVSDPMKKVLMCAGCVRRERKRAERKKDSPSIDASSINADEVFAKDRERILLFNCEPLINFSSGDAILPTRITCYCRHHNERVGFRIRFTMKDNKGNIIATATTPPIMITDDHKSNTKHASNSSTVGRKRRRTEYERKRLEPSTPVSSRQGSVCFSTQGDAAVISTVGDAYPSSSFPYFNIPHCNNNASIIPEYYTPLPTPSEERSFGPFNGEPLAPWTAQHRASDSISTPDIPASMPTALPGNVAQTTSTQSDVPYVFPTSVERPTPRLDRLVPNQGPTYGGIEVTILGSGFYRGLTCLFGDRPAVTLCWSATTLVCVLPAALQPGPVVVSFKEHPLIVEGSDVTIFTYYDANDQALLELALQVVGLKMTGKLHDAKRVAMGIVQGDQRQQPAQVQNSGAVQQQVIDALDSVDVQDVSLMNARGHTMLHLAVICGYDDLVRLLVNKGADIEAGDRNGHTPLFLACWKGAKTMIETMLESKGSSLVASKSYTSLISLNESATEQAAAATVKQIRSDPPSRQSSLKIPSLRRFHSLDADVRTAPAKNMEENGLGIVQPKRDSRLYVFWVPLLLVMMAFLYCQVLDKQIFSLVADALPFRPRNFMYHYH